VKTLSRLPYKGAMTWLRGPNVQPAWDVIIGPDSKRSQRLQQAGQRVCGGPMPCLHRQTSRSGPTSERGAIARLNASLDSRYSSRLLGVYFSAYIRGEGYIHAEGGGH
jgi:hypothetical protein